MKRPVIFLPDQLRHWEMFLPLAEHLKALSINVWFASLEGFAQKNSLPLDFKTYKVNVWTPRFKVSIPRNKYHFAYLTYRYLLPEWRSFLKNQGGNGMVVTGQDGRVLFRILLKEANKLGYKTVVFQDGYFARLPMKWGWDHGSRLSILKRKIVTKTPLASLINLPFGSASQYCGLFGSTIKERIESSGLLNGKELKVIGCVRHAIIKKKFQSFGIKKTATRLNFLVFPRTFRVPSGKAFYLSQQEAFTWVINALGKVFENQADWRLYIKPKRNNEQYVRSLVDQKPNPRVVFLDADTGIIELLDEIDVVFTTGSTAALEATVCRRPVIQVMPELLYKSMLAIPGIPVAKNETELIGLLRKALADPEGFCAEYRAEVNRELADIDNNWDSVKECTQWLFTILNS